MNSNRKPIIAGNWKMYKTAAEALALVNELTKQLVGINDSHVEVVICPPFTALYAVGFDRQTRRAEHSLGKGGGVHG
jgi:triosephosphate isomerase